MSLKVAKIVMVEDVEVAVVDEAVIVDTIVVGIEADMTMIEATEEVMMTAEEEAMTMGVSIYAKSDVHTCIIHMKV